MNDSIMCAILRGRLWGLCEASCSIRRRLDPTRQGDAEQYALRVTLEYIETLEASAARTLAYYDGDTTESLNVFNEPSVHHSAS